MYNKKSMYFLRKFDINLENSIKKINGISPLLARLLSQRKIDDIDGFLNLPQDTYLYIKNMSYLAKEVRVASNFLIDASKNKKSIAVIGDYDTDGIISSYMIKRLCEIMDIECNVFLPSRFEHGYGLSEQTLASFLAFTVMNQTPDILFIVDCGSSSEKEIHKLKSFGINNVVVVDHHIIQENQFSKSANSVINWRKSDGQEMCSCGLVYLIALDMFTTHTSHGILSRDNIKEMLSLASIGTIADISPIIGDNRIIVKMGLSFFDKLSSKGLAILIELCKLNNATITQEQVGFRLAPRLNAVGRLGSPQEAFDLLISKDNDEINDIIKVLETTNKQRQQIQSSMLDEAIAMVDEDKMQYGIFLVNPNWNIGVVGIVASEIVEKFHRPTIVVGREKGIWKGSGRSTNKLSLIKILDLCSEMFDKYGGHDFAAGVALKKNFIDKSVKIFNNVCQVVLSETEGDCNKKILYDATLKPVSINEETYKLVKLLYPYCEINNPEPVFKLSGLKILSCNKKAKDNWTLFVFKVKGVPFKFKTFSKEIGEKIIKNDVVDIYFKFPQHYDEKWGMQLNVVGIEKIK